MGINKCPLPLQNTNHEVESCGDGGGGTWSGTQGMRTVYTFPQAPSRSLDLGQDAEVATETVVTIAQEAFSLAKHTSPRSPLTPRVLVLRDVGNWNAKSCWNCKCGKEWQDIMLEREAGVRVQKTLSVRANDFKLEVFRGWSCLSSQADCIWVHSVSFQNSCTPDLLWPESSLSVSAPN